MRSNNPTHDLFNLLANASKNFDKKKMIKATLEIFPNVTYYLPPDGSIKLAYLEFAEKNKPNESFVLHYLQTLFADIKNATNKAITLEQLCAYDFTQLEELNRTVAELIVTDWTMQFGALDDAKQQHKLEKYLIRLLSAVNNAEPRRHLISTLRQANQHAARLAKAIYLVCAVELGYDDIITFLGKHAANADYLAEIIILFHQGFNEEINQSFLDFLAAHEDQARAFYACAETDETLNRLMDLVDENILTVENMKALFDHAHQINDVIIALTDLYALNPVLCEENAKLIIENSDVPHLLNSIKILLEQHKSQNNPLIDPENELAELMREKEKKSLPTHTLTHGIFARTKSTEHTEEKDVLENNIGLDKSK